MSSDIGNWDACFGATVDGCSEAAAALSNNKAGAIVCPEKDAYYTFTANFATMSYEWKKLENQEPKEYEFIELLGDFNGWPGNGTKGEVMKKLEKAPHNWYLAGLKIESAGNIKFRADANWSVNWGAGVDIATDNSGVGVQNGDNNKIPAGTYNVFFNDITGQFVFKAVE